MGVAVERAGSVLADELSYLEAAGRFSSDRVDDL